MALNFSTRFSFFALQLTQSLSFGPGPSSFSFFALQQPGAMREPGTGSCFSFFALQLTHPFISFKAR